MSLLGIAGLVTGLGSAIWGGVSSSNAASASKKEVKRQAARENAWFNKRYNEKYVDTASGRAALEEAKEYAKENWKKAAGSAAVAGGTDAAVAEAKNAGNKMMAQTVRGMAAQDTARQDSAYTSHQTAQDKYSSQIAALNVQKAQAIAKAAGSASDAVLKGVGEILGDNVAKDADTAAAADATTADVSTDTVLDSDSDVGYLYDYDDYYDLLGDKPYIG